MPLRDLVILLTPPGAAAIAVVRLSGAGVMSFLAARFSRPLSENRVVHGNLVDESGNVIDDAVVVISRGGAVADINLHGGPWVVQSALDLARRAGFELRTASDAPEIAWDGTATLQREVLESLPLARTERGLKTLLAQPRAWAEAISKLHRGDLERVLADRSLEHLLHPPRVAIVGAPNVGKSTLANQLFAQERSITADLPGTTRDWVGEIANIDGLPVMLVDTPGVRDAVDPIEREAIERSRAEVDRAETVVVVLDATRPIEPEQGPLLRRYDRAVVMVNKIDRVPDWDRVSVDLSTVATTGAGVPQLRRAILADLGCADVDPSRPRVWTKRQREIVRRALDDGDALREL